ncbi:MAG: RNA polymerase sporulation sigma factor SigH [Armatimonadota bacterium]|nr:RNA polymerase sporulation sigma factor SigH [Armatimonadota bacterium]
MAMTEHQHNYDEATLCTAHMADEELVFYAKQGNERAAETLLKRYRGLVESKARLYFLVGADHEDVIQEGLIGLYKAIRDFRYERVHKFRPFAELCVTRQIISAVKAATRQKHIPLNDYVSLYRPLQNHHNDETDSNLTDILPDPNALTPEQWILQRRIPLAVMHMAREKMSELERKVLDFYLDGMSYKQMSEILCRGTKCIDNALQRVKKKLIQVYEENYGDSSQNGRRKRRPRIIPELDDNLV